MGANILGKIKTRQIARLCGEPVVWAWVLSHHQCGRWARVTTASHGHGWWDRWVRRYYPDSQTGLGGCSSSCATLFADMPDAQTVRRRVEQMLLPPVCLRCGHRHVGAPCADHTWSDDCPYTAGSNCRRGQGPHERDERPTT